MPGLRLAGASARPRRALHIQADGEGPAYYRTVLPAAAINWRPDIPWEVASELLVHTDLLDQVDLVLGQRICTPSGWTLWGLATADGGPATAFETDDLLTEVPRTNPNHKIYANPETQRTIREAMGRADAVVVSTEPLAEELRELNETVYVIPNRINGDFIRETPCKPRGDRPGRRRMGGRVRPTVADLATVERHLRRSLEDARPTGPSST